MLKIIDLFAGVGGMSLGAIAAGFDVVGAVELDKINVETHKINFPYTKHLLSDISILNGNDILKEFELNINEIDGIIGGPPCQGFSSIGKRDISDPRNKLFFHFFRLVNELKPNFFVAENVPGILNEKYNAVRNQAFKLVEDEYTMLLPISMSANDYGAPTTRTRIFFIGYKNGTNFNFKENNFLSSKTTNFVTVGEALSGLPLVPSYNIKSQKKENQIWMEIEKKQNKGYLEALFKNNLNSIKKSEAFEQYKINKVSGMIGTAHADKVIERFSKTLAGKTDKVSRSYRLKLDGFCPTLRAGTGKDNGSFQAVRPIHPTEERVITPREAARLQGFPDWFQFHPTKWNSFRQIGNSVCPVVSRHIFCQIKKQYDKHIYENKECKPIEPINC